jgi:hypothetical protein
VNWKGYQDLVEFNTTVELVERISKTPTKWRLTLRKEVLTKDQDHWWTEELDAVVSPVDITASLLSRGKSWRGMVGVNEA